jgi:hypothetical protein
MSQHNRSLKLAIPLLALLPFLHAKDGRDFAGTYHVTAAVVQGANVQVALAFDITNYSGGDVAGGTLTLLDRLRSAKTYGSFIAPAIADRDTLQTQHDFAIPSAEYQSWLNGATPLLVFDRKDPSGRSLRRRVPLVRIP